MTFRKLNPPLHNGARLALIRRTLSLTSFKMAQLIGTDMPIWESYEASSAGAFAIDTSSSG
jgi:hypothetical protein